MSAQSRILARVQKNPEIGTDEATYVTELVDRAIDFVKAECRYSDFPGATDDAEADTIMDTAAVMICEALVAKKGVEGFASASTPWGASFQEAAQDPKVAPLLAMRRKLWSDVTFDADY